MKRAIMICMIIICFGLISIYPVPAWGAKKSDEFKEVASELVKGGVSEKDIDKMQGSMENMFRKGANKEDVKTVVINLTRMGLFGRELTDSVKNVSDLVNEGENVKEAGNVVSKAAHEAKRKGLKGRALAAEVHKAVRQRKEERNKAKQAKKAQKQKAKGVPAGKGGRGKGK